MSLAPKGAAAYPRKGRGERGSDIARSQRIHEIGSACEAHRLDEAVGVLDAWLDAYELKL